MDVYDSFNHEDCSATEIGTFPVCSQSNVVLFVSEASVRAEAEAVSRPYQTIV